MKVLVIAPPYPLEECPAPPLGVAYVAANFLEAGAEVRVVDYIVNRYTTEKFRDLLDDFEPDVIGANSVTMNFPGAADIIRTAKRHRPSAITMMGGCHVSFDIDGTLTTYPEIDLLVLGEGERTIADLMNCFSKGEDWRKTKGIAFRDEGRIVVNEPQEFIEDLDSLPFPARHLLPLSRYQALGYPASLITGRGCPYSCIFCVGRRMVGKKPRQRKASFVVDEIEEILGYGFNRINIVDDLFTSNHQKVREVCEEINKRNLRFTWTAFARVNTVTAEILEMMRKAGCDCISFGMETGNREMLKRIRKGATLEQARQAAQLCKDAGIIAHASFMVGLPGENWETLKDTADFSSSLDIIYGFHILAPFPGTTVREEKEKYDIEILTDDWNRYDANQSVVRTSALSDADIEKFVADFDGQLDEAWQKMLYNYHHGTPTAEETMRVAGHYRTQFVYKLLSEDILEKNGSFPMKILARGPNGSVDPLCQRLQALTGGDADIIKKTIEQFVGLGYLKSRQEGDNLIWHWTHNNRIDR
ncbi:MAG: radical SAM protein, partial [Deltaproteobacteria bacterium]|nr:radical SAM protein [Deltaproteobacteria bacterium]